METPESLIARNVAELRAKRGLSVRELSARLAGLGHKLLPSGITKIENQARGVDVGDLVALAIALGVNPNRLLLPSRAGDDVIALTPTTQAPQWAAWLWADGRQPLPSRPADDEEEPFYTTEEFLDFQDHARPGDVRVREQHAALQAAQETVSRLHRLLTRTDPQGRRAQRRLTRHAMNRLVAAMDELLDEEDGDDAR